MINLGLLLLIFSLGQIEISYGEPINRNISNTDLKPRLNSNITNDITYVDLQIKNNAINHHTNVYRQIDLSGRRYQASPSVVLRRGSTINITIQFRYDYDKEIDKIRLEFSFGQRPQLDKGTLVYVPIETNRDPSLHKDGYWDASLLNVIDNNRLNVQIYIPANVAIGVWNFKLSTKLINSKILSSYTIREAIYIVFNAWSKDDAVFLPREDARQEYVLNEVGKIYIGSRSLQQGRKWTYGQFHETVLPSMMYLLDKTRLDIVGRADVVKVSRAVSALVNSHDDGGLLVGNWSGNYGDGLAPWQWSGSASVFDNYYRSGGRPVKFGQCWVFAGVTTTALRTLGIPARSVSNFLSAHDTDHSLTVDKFYNENGGQLTDVNTDSIWNFHVWSDAWMARYDLPSGYGGWQAIDATPQETSDGSYQLGPASLEAVKRGEVGFAYDVAFVFAEVNADVVHWQLDRSRQQWQKFRVYHAESGTKILTKKIGQLDTYTRLGIDDNEDITLQYKYPEGSEDERMAVANAARSGGLGFLFNQPVRDKEDVGFTLSRLDKVVKGEALLVNVTISNRSQTMRTISLTLTASNIHFTGVLAQKFKQDRQNVVLKGSEEQNVTSKVNPEDYSANLVDYPTIKVYVIAIVKETQQIWSKEKNVVIS